MKFTVDNIKELKTISITIITLSDRASKGVYKDLSGPQIKSMIETYFVDKKWNFNIKTEIIPDNANMLKDILIKAKKTETDIIITTGGTGIGPKDITPDIVKPLLDKEIPGIMELIRVKYGMNIPNAVLSRGVAGIIGKSQIYTLPGSVKAVKDYMKQILKTLEHLIYMQLGLDVHKKHN